MLALPVPTLWHIQGPRSEKIGILAAFLVGALSTIAACIEMYSVHIYTKTQDPSRAAPLVIWCFIEVNLSILCASVPGKVEHWLRAGLFC